LWAGLWALASKLFQHRFEFAAHLRLALPVALGFEVLDTVLPPLGAALAGWEFVGAVPAHGGLSALYGAHMQRQLAAPRAPGGGRS
jgi:hypothetical protein